MWQQIYTSGKFAALTVIETPVGRQSDTEALFTNVLDRVLGSSSGRGYFVVFLGKIPPKTLRMILEN